MSLTPWSTASGPEYPPELLKEDGELVLFRAWYDGTDGNRQRVLVLQSAAEQPAPNVLNRLAHAYALKDQLDASWAIRPVELLHDHERTSLVLESPDGLPLEHYIGAPLEPELFLRLGIATSIALGRLHERGLVHKDIKPKNIFVNATTGEAWLTGFGIASRAPRERQSPDPPEFIAGTLAFDRVVANGRAELVLVSGYSGIGKSAVVNELHKPLVPPRGLFAAGKFDQYKRDIPYATLAQAFQSLIRRLLSKSEEELSTWRDALHEALGPNGQLIVDLVPELKLVMGEQPPVPELPPQDAQRRFQLVFRQFIGVFARPEHPLALFLDDLQWLDAATLDLLEALLNRSDLRNLLVIVWSHSAMRNSTRHNSPSTLRPTPERRRAHAGIGSASFRPACWPEIPRRRSLRPRRPKVCCGLRLDS
jgi:serine/threonine protein kinase